MQSETITLWTLQPSYVWYALQEKGTLLVDPHHPDFLSDIDDFREAYDWLREQMTQRIPNYSGNYPWWAYEHYLDLRYYRWNHPARSTQMVRLELKIPRERVLLSGHQSWHCVLNRWYLPRALAWEEYGQERDAWDSEAIKHGADWNSPAPYPEPWESQLRASWEHIFDVEQRRSKEVIQATFERLDFADVIRVTEYTPARCRTN